MELFRNSRLPDTEAYYDPETGEFELYTSSGDWLIRGKPGLDRSTAHDLALNMSRNIPPDAEPIP